MTEKELENELKYLEISVEQLKRIALQRKLASRIDFRGIQCTDNDMKRVCTNIRKSALNIKRYACLYR